MVLERVVLRELYPEINYVMHVSPKNIVGG